MATLKKLGDRAVRLKCDCGQWVHDVTADENGKLEVESYNTGKKVEPEPPKPLEPVKLRKSIFD